MITKESHTLRKCCLYASDFHLEMILLPYIKENINKSNFVIFSQNDLSGTIKILLDRVNIEDKEKKCIINLNWKQTAIEDILNNSLNKSNQDIHIIINGDYNYIKEVNNKIKILGDNIHIVDCFNVNDEKIDVNLIKEIYQEIINTSKI